MNPISSEMERSRATFEILAGLGIGPFRLGMTRAQAREIAQRELGIDMDVTAARGHDYDAIADTGLMIHYDENGCCERVSVFLGYTPHVRYAFTLFGEEICGKDDTYVTQLCKNHWPDVRDVYVGLKTGIKVRSVGLSAGYWENSSDGCFFWVDVEPPESPSGATV
jgi:hypothetical protein